jgi:membrane associated rhomboid family serine protease
MLNNLPPVTKNLLLLNIALYVISIGFKMSGGLDLSALLGSHYFLSPVFEPVQILSHMFMHSDESIMHIFFNMFLLVIFGSHLERLWGAKHFFIFYFACGLGSFVLTNVVTTFEYNHLIDTLNAMGINVDSVNNAIPSITYNLPSSYVDALGPIVITQEKFDVAGAYASLMVVPGVGASGAIFGLLAAFALLFPNTEMQILFIPMPIKAKYLIGAYVLYEVYRGFNPVAGDNVAHWAHIGGALVGAIIVLVRRKTNKTNFY